MKMRLAFFGKKVGDCPAWIHIVNPRDQVLDLKCDLDIDHTGNHEHGDKYGGRVTWSQ